MLEREAEGVRRQAAQGPSWKSQERSRVACLKAGILHDSAREVRNQTAGLALEAYYSLAETEARRELVQIALVTVSDSAKRLKELKMKGAKPPAELEAIERKQVELLSDLKQLELGEVRLQFQLGRLLGLDQEPQRYEVRPVLDASDLTPPGVLEAEVARGLACRPELAMWRSLNPLLDAKTLPSAIQVLRTVNPLAGMDTPSPTHLVKLHLLCKQDEDLSTSRDQIAQYSAERERAIAGDIQADVTTVQFRMELLALAHQRAADWQARVEELEEKETKGVTSSTETAAARLEWAHARGEVIREISAVARAVVKLKQDEGLLATDGCEAPPALNAGNTCAPCMGNR